jgi:hypothetical protein
MTELAGIGSAEAGNPAGGNDDAGKGSTAEVAATNSTSPEAAAKAAAPADNLDWAKAKGWVAEDGSVKSDEVLKGYQNLEKAMGSKVSIPDEKSKPEEVEGFYKKLGWPGAPEGYEFTRAEGLPENLPYDETFAGEFKQWANELKLSTTQAQALHDKWVGAFAETFKNDVDTFASERMEMAKKASADLVADWGDPKSETFTQNIDAATRALRSDPKLEGLEAEFKKSGILTSDGRFTSTAIANLLAGYGKQLQNDALIGNNAGGSTNGNPFASGTPAYDISKAREIIKSDPAKARSLASAAGWPQESIDLIGK